MISQSPQEAEKKQKKFKKSILLLFILLVAFIVRLIYLWGQYQHNPIFNTPIIDSLVHHQWALKIASGEGMGSQPYFRAPLYYYFLAIIYKLFGPNIGVARLLQCLMGSISCYFIGLIGYRLKGFWTGMLAGIIAAFYWPFIYFDVELLTVGLEIFLDLLLLWTLFQAESKRSWTLFIVSGFFLGLSAITRPNILVFIPVILAWLIANSKTSQKRVWAFLMTVLVLIGAALPILPVTFRNYFIGGEPILISSNGGVNFYIGNNPLSDGITAAVPGTRHDFWGGYEDTHLIPQMELGRELKEAEISDYWYKKSFQWIRSEPGEWARLMFKKFLLFSTTHELPNNKPIYFFARFAPVSAIFWVGFSLVATLGLAALIFIKQRWHTCFLLLSFMILYMCSVVLFFCPARYRLPVVPILILLASMGVSYTIEDIKLKSFKLPSIYFILCTIIATALYLNPLRYSYKLSHQEAQGHCILGIVLAKQEKLDDAIEEYNQSLQINPYDPRTHCKLGFVLAKQGKTGKAIERFQEALRINPAQLEARFRLGTCLFEEGKLEEAIEHYYKALRINPAYVEIYNNLGNAYLKKGLIKEAIDEYKKALKINPDCAEAHNNLGLVCVQKDRLDEAISQFKQALNINPNLATGHYNLGLIYDKKGMLDEAISEFKKALDLKPHYAEAHYNIGLAYYKKGGLDEAISEYKQALDINPDYAKAHCNLGVVYGSKKMFDEAISECKKAIAINPNYANAHYNIGIAYYYKGNYKLAIFHCDKAVELGERVSPRLSELLKPYR